MSEDNKYLTVYEAAKELGGRCSTNYVSLLLREGKLTGIKERSGWLVDPLSIQAYKAKQAERLGKKS